jgi:hypothetical protein
MQSYHNARKAFDHLVRSGRIAGLTRQRQSEFTTMIANLGPVRSVLFKGVAPDGADVFDVRFENGPMEWQIVPTEEEDVDQIRFTFMIKSVG